MDESVYEALNSWAKLIIKENSETKDEWTDIPNIGKFKNLKIVSEPSELDDEISITLKYEKWEESTTGKLIRGLVELIEMNFGLDQYLLDDPEHHHYSKHPELYIYPGGKDNQNDTIIISESSTYDTVSVSGPKNIDYVCKKDYDGIIACIYTVIEKYRNNSNKEYPPMPCEKGKRINT